MAKPREYPAGKGRYINHPSIQRLLDLLIASLTLERTVRHPERTVRHPECTVRNPERTVRHSERYLDVLL